MKLLFLNKLSPSVLLFLALVLVVPPVVLGLESVSETSLCNSKYCCFSNAHLLSLLPERLAPSRDLGVRITLQSKGVVSILFLYIFPALPSSATAAVPLCSAKNKHNEKRGRVRTMFAFVLFCRLHTQHHIMFSIPKVLFFPSVALSTLCVCVWTSRILSRNQ